jgi:hypothetical protein
MSVNKLTYLFHWCVLLSFLWDYPEKYISQPTRIIRSLLYTMDLNSHITDLTVILPNLGMRDFAVRLLVPSMKNSIAASPSVTSFWTYSLNVVQYNLSLPKERLMKKAQLSRSKRPISHMEWKSAGTKTICPSLWHRYHDILKSSSLIQSHLCTDVIQLIQKF